MSARVHPTAIVDPSAELADGVEVGAYSVIGAGVVVGPASRIESHVVVQGPTQIGARNVILPFAVLGTPPQDRSYAQEPTKLVIGDDNTIREHVTMHRGTKKGGGVTRVGNGGLFMVGSHVAHDATVGDNVVLTNSTLLGGHCQIGSWVVTGGHAAVAPFAIVGESAFLAAGAMVEQDIPPFVVAAGDRARVRAINKVGLRRRGVAQSSIEALESAFRSLFLGRAPRSITLRDLRDRALEDRFVAGLIAFMISAKRPIAPGPKH